MSTVTLFRRPMNGQKVYNSHQAQTYPDLGVAVNICWLL
jgi:hypothetical protein